MQKFTPNEFSSRKREKLLDYKNYQYNYDEPMETFDVARQSLAQPDAVLAEIDPYDLMVCTKQRAWDATDFLLNCYSGGHDIGMLAALVPAVVEYWEVYAGYSKICNDSGDGPSDVAHIPLLGSEYAFANQLLCFSILLGHGKLVPRIAAIIDYNNPSTDGLLERLIQSFVEGRGEAPTECTKHLPYFKTLKIFSAPEAERPALMKEYLDDWYEASRREPYYNSHKKGQVFHGYWAWEAAAITYLLDIDDSNFVDANFYPADLVKFARTIHAPTGGSRVAGDDNELRAKSGEPCPKAGEWETLDIPPQRRQFAAGALLESTNAAYGVTVWRFIAW